MRRGEVWFADSGDGGDRPVLVLTRDPVSDRIGAVVVAALTTTPRRLSSHLPLTAAVDGVAVDCAVNFDTIYTLGREAFRRHLTTLSEARMMQACRALRAAVAC